MDAIGPFIPLIVLLLVLLGLFYWHLRHKAKNGLKGAMGWILVFNLQSLFGLSTYFNAQISQSPMADRYAYTGIVVLILVLYTWHLTINKQHDANTPSKIIKVIWIKGPLIFLFTYIADILWLRSLPTELLNLPNKFFKEFYLTPLFGLAALIIMATIWTLYFKKSKRVANTYLAPAVPTY